jgi:hypothetical protein
VSLCGEELSSVLAITFISIDIGREWDKNGGVDFALVFRRLCDEASPRRTGGHFDARRSVFFGKANRREACECTPEGAGSARIWRDM